MNTFRTAVAVVCASLVWSSVGSAGVYTGGSILDEGPGGDLYVAYDDHGTLTVDAGSGLNRDHSYVGYGAGCTGTAMVSGTGSTWNNHTFHVGEEGTGTVNIVAGAEVSGGAVLGYSADSTGTVTVSGTGSMWNNGHFTVGYNGSGTLNILAGGQVTGSCLMADRFGSAGTATVSGINSTWTGVTFEVGTRGDGTLNILDGGQVNSSTGHLGFYGTGTATVSGAGSIWTLTHATGVTVGYYGTGTLDILAGGQVSGGLGTIGGAGTDSIGTVTVSGAGSTWTCSRSLYVGYWGTGTLNILDGGHVSNTEAATVASQNTSTGAATVSGAGSTWAISGPLYVGYLGNSRGTLTVSDGGQVTADELLSWTTNSLVNLHVSGDDMLVLGNAGTIGSVTNNGTIRFYADPFLPVGVYTPISEFAGRAMSWSGSGAYKAYGGAWNAGNKTFEVSATTLLDAGAVDDVSSGERLLFTDAGSGDSVGVGFGAVPSGTTFSASLLSPADLAALAALPEVEGQVLAGWDFTTTLTGQDVLLSFDVGEGMTDLASWHLDGGVWSSYSPGSFTYDASGNVSFTASQFSGYAVTGVVPEPASLTLLALGGLTVGVLTLTRRRRKP